VKLIIKSTNVKNAASPDLINHYLLKLIPDIGLKKLRDIYKMILKGILSIVVEKLHDYTNSETVKKGLLEI